MKMIIRMFCAVALVAGAFSLTACSKEEAKPATKSGETAKSDANKKAEKPAAEKPAAEKPAEKPAKPAN